MAHRFIGAALLVDFHQKSFDHELLHSAGLPEHTFRVNVEMKMARFDGADGTSFFGGLALGGLAVREREGPLLDQLPGLFLIHRADAERRAQPRDGACAAGRPPGMTDARGRMPDQPMRQHGPLRARKQGPHLELDLDRVRLRGPAEPPRQPAEMGVHGDAGHAERVPEHHVRRFPADAGQRDEVFQAAWDLTAVPVAQRLAKRDEAGRLGPVEPGRLDDLFHVFTAAAA